VKEEKRKRKEDRLKGLYPWESSQCGGEGKETIKGLETFRIQSLGQGQVYHKISSRQPYWLDDRHIDRPEG